MGKGFLVLAGLAAVLGAVREGRAQTAAQTTPMSARISDEFVVGWPAAQGGLAVYPIIRTAGRAAPSPDYRLLGESMADRTVTIRETDGRDLGLTEIPERGGSITIYANDLVIGSEVPSLQARNTGAQSVILLPGDCVTGGNQDRVIIEETVLPPLSSWVPVPVHCVEHGRSEPRTRGATSFAYGGRVEGALQRTIRLRQDQQATWDAVAALNAAKRWPRETLSAPDDHNPTGTYLESLADRASRGLAERSADALRPALLADGRTVGLVVALGGEVVHAELYGQSRWFRLAASRTLLGYALDALSLGVLAEPAQAPSAAEAAAFVRDAMMGAAEELGNGPGFRRIGTEGEAARGWALSDGSNRVLHLAVHRR